MINQNNIATIFVGVFLAANIGACPPGIENGVPTFMFGEGDPQNYYNTDTTKKIPPLWRADIKFDPFQKKKADANSKGSNSIFTDVLASGDLTTALKGKFTDAEIAEKRQAISQAMYLNTNIDPELSSNLHLVREYFIKACCPIADMKVNVIVQKFPHPRTPNQTVTKLRGFGISGCPLQNTDDFARIGRLVSSECMVDRVKDKDFFDNTEKMTNLLVGCAIAIDQGMVKAKSKTVKEGHASR